MKTFLVAGVLASCAFAGVAQAQVVAGTEQGIRQGDAAAGPVGGVVGGAVGAATGTVGLATNTAGDILDGTLLTGRSAFVDPLGMTNPSLGQYAAAEGLPSYPYDGPVRVGARLPHGLTYYVVPASYGATSLRYTVVNNQTVLVDPRTRRIAQIVN